MSTLTDHELETRLRSTYRSVTAATVATPRPLPDRSPRAVVSLRMSIALASIVAIVLLGVVVAQRHDEAVGRGGGQRWALVPVYQGGLVGVRPDDATIDGLGPQRGDVVEYRRGDAVLRVMSLRDASIDDDRLVEDDLAGSSPVLVTPDGRLAARRMAGDLTLVLRYDGDTDAEHAPDLATLARGAVTIGDAAWARAQQRQGFATMGDDTEPSVEFRFDDGLVLRRSAYGSLRSGVSAVYSTVGADADTGWFGVPSGVGEPWLQLLPWDDHRATVSATSPISAVTIDGQPVALDEVVDPDSGVVTRWALAEVTDGVHEVVGRGADGRVISTTRWSLPQGIEVEAP